MVGAQTGEAEVDDRLLAVGRSPSAIQHGPRQGAGTGRAGPAYPPPGVSRSCRMASAAALSGARSLVTISQTRRSFTFG
jgi:hypothetical protein